MLAAFVEDLLARGEVRLRERPRPEKARPRELVRAVERAHEAARLALAGPPVELDLETAIAAAELVRAFSYELLTGERTLGASPLDSPGKTTASAHLSADLFLRFLPQVLARSRALGPVSELATSLETVLRRWPLSGVLADIDEAPLSPLDFGHDGLAFLYGERLARNPRPAWFPEGPCGERVALVFQELGKEAAGG